MKLYIAPKGNGVEKAKEIPNIDMVRIFTNIDGKIVVETCTAVNQCSAYNAKRHNFWIVHTENEVR